MKLSISKQSSVKLAPGYSKVFENLCGIMYRA